MNMRYQWFLIILLLLSVSNESSYVITSTASGEFSAPFDGKQQAIICTSFDTRAETCINSWTANPQAIPTIGGTRFHRFTIRNITFIAIANQYTGSSFSVTSVIYHWNAITSQFAHYQSVATLGAHDWDSFTIGNDTYLAVSNFAATLTDTAINSVIYRWNPNTLQFVNHQNIATRGCRDMESFTIGNNTFLAVANFRDNTNHAINSIIYRWDSVTTQFVSYQSIATVGAAACEYFTIGNNSFLAISNHYSGSTYGLTSVIYRWNAQTAQFISHQSVATQGARGWKSFTIDNITYLALANWRSDSSYTVNSVIYRWNTATAQFVHHQSIATLGAAYWESFTVGDDTFLAVANWGSASSQAVESVIYRWNSATAQFVSHQSIATLGAVSWQSFTIHGNTFLSVANFQSDSTRMVNSMIYRLAAVQPLRSNDTHVQMYLALGGTTIPCLFSPQRTQSPRLRYIEALSIGYTFAVKASLPNGSPAWYPCDGNMSALQFWNTSSPIPACPLSAVVECGIAGSFLSQAANWRAGVRHANNSMEVLATRSVFQLHDIVLMIDSVLPETSRSGAAVLKVTGRGWKSSNYMLEITATMNGQPCPIDHTKMTETELYATCMVTSWTSGAFSVTAGNQVYETNVALAPHVIISQTELQWDDHTLLSGQELGLQHGDRLMFVGVANNSSFQCALLILDGNSAECHIRMLPRVALPLTARIYIVHAGSTYATALILTFLPTAIPDLVVSNGAVCQHSVVTLAIPRRRLTSSDFLSSGLSLAPTQRLDDVQVWIGGVACHNATFVADMALTCVAPRIPFDGVPVTIQLAQQINLTSFIVMVQPGITFIEDKQVVTLLSNRSDSSVRITATGICIACTPSDLIPWSISLLVMHQECQRIVCESQQVIRCEGIHLNASDVEATAAVDATLPGTRRIPITAHIQGVVVQCATCLVAAVRPVLLSVQPTSIAGAGAVLTISGYHLLDEGGRSIVVVMVGHAACNNVTVVSMTSLTCTAPNALSTTANYPLLSVRLHTVYGIVSDEVLYIRYPSAFSVEWEELTPVIALSSGGNNAFEQLSLHPAPKFHVASTIQTTCTVRVAQESSMQCSTPNRAVWDAPSAFTLRGDTFVETQGSESMTVFSMARITAHGPSGCSTNLSVICTDALGRTASSVSDLRLSIPSWSARWTNSTTVIAAPTTLPPLMARWSVFYSNSFRNISALPSLASCIAVVSLQSIAARWRPHDNLRFVDQNEVTASQQATLREAEPGTLELVWNGLNMQTAVLGARYSLLADCTWTATSERIRLPPINISVPTITLVVRETSSSSTRVVAASSTDILLAAEVLTDMPLALPAMSCNWLTVSRTSNQIVLDAPQQQDIAASAPVTVLQPLQLVANGDAPSLVTVLQCEVWSHFIRSNPITLVSAPMEIVTLTSLPTLIIPSDTGSRWLVNSSVTFGVRPLFDNATGNFFRGADIRCALSVTGAEQAALIPADASTPLSAYTEVTANDAGTISFPRFGVRVDPSLRSVTMSVDCNRPAGDGPPPFTWHMEVVALRVTLCSADEVFTQTSVAFAVVATVTGACNAIPPLRLPPVVCTLQPINMSVVVQGGVTEADEISGQVRFPAVVVTAQPGSVNELRLTCYIGSLTIPPMDGVSLITTLTGCSPGQFVSNSFCRGCNPGQYSLGGAATQCKSCPVDGVTCVDGIISLLPNYYRPQRVWGMPLDITSELYPCFNGEACISNTSMLSHSCAEGYVGPLCGVCDTDADYARMGDTCRSCGDISKQAGLLALLLLAVIVLLTYVALRRDDGKRHEASIVLKITMSYLQAIGSLRTFQAGGTKAYNDLMGWTDVVSASPISINSLQCIWKPPFLVQYVVTILVPLLAAVVVIVIFVSVTLARAVRWHKLTAPCVRRDVADAPQPFFNRSRFAAAMNEWLQERRHIATTVFVVFVAYMGIISASLRAVDCYDRPIDGVTYLRSDLGVRCYSGEHIVAVVIACICLIVFGAGFPIGLYWYLATSSAEQLADTQLQAAWGFLYDGYRGAELTQELRKQPQMPATVSRRASRQSLVSMSASAARLSVDTKQRCGVAWRRMKAGHVKWWEAVVLVRKTGVVFMSVLLTDPFVQTAAAAIWCMLFLSLHLHFAPYASFTFNMLETMSLTAATLTTVITFTLLRYDVTDPAFKSRATSAMTSDEWAVTGLLAAINLTTLIILAVVWLYHQCRRVSEATHAIRHRDGVSFSRNSRSRVVQNPLASWNALAHKHVEVDFHQANPLRVAAQSGGHTFPPVGVHGSS